MALRPAEMVLPDLEEWVTLLELEDAVGDETGDGDYVYPLATDFNTPTVEGCGTHAPHGASERMERSILLTMSEMTDIWGLANGFSHKSSIYVDQGRRVMAVHHAHRRQRRGSSRLGMGGGHQRNRGPGAVQAVQAETGSASARGIDVSGDVERKPSRSP